MGVAYNKLKEYQEAIDTYKEAIKIKPDDHEAYYNMGVAYDKLPYCNKPHDHQA
jgi:tetratricopeptide (TPR) repeat protein